MTADKTHVSAAEANKATSGKLVDIAEPHDPARYRKLIVGAVVGLIAYLFTVLALPWDSEVEKAVTLLVTLIAVERTPNAT